MGKWENVYLMNHWGSAARHFEDNECDLTGSIMKKSTIQISIQLGSLCLVLDG